MEKSLVGTTWGSGLQSRQAIGQSKLSVGRTDDWWINMCSKEGQVKSSDSSRGLAAGTLGSGQQNLSYDWGRSRSHTASRDLSARYVIQGHPEYIQRPRLTSCNTNQRSVPASDFQSFLLLKQLQGLSAALRLIPKSISIISSLFFHSYHHWNTHTHMLIHA